MPNISRDTFKAEKNYVKTIFQIGEPVVDNEVNEAQDIKLVHVAENGWASAGFLRSTDLRISAFGGFRFGAAVRNNWLCAAEGTNDVFVRAGTIFVDGFSVILPEDVSLNDEGLGFDVAASGDTYGYVYVDFYFSEVDSIEDPEIAREGVGETSRRLKLRAEFKTAESSTGYSDAFSSIPDLAADDYYDPSARIWKGNVARIFLCRYFRADGSTVINQEDLVDLRQDIPGEAANKHTFIKTLRGGDEDGMLVWDSANSYLEVGIATNGEFPAGAQKGFLLTTAGSPDLYASRSSNTVWVGEGAGSANGTQRLPGAGSFGWTIVDGSALGYSSAGVPAQGFPRKKALDPEYILTTGTHSLYSLNPDGVSFDLAPLLEQNLVVIPFDYFVGDPSVFVICVRRGDDLIWFDGTVTRGNAQHPVFEELGGTPSPYSAVVGNEGKNHLTKNDAVERALNYLSSGTGTGNLGYNRSIRLFIRRGTWDFARAVHKYGNYSEVLALSDEYDVNSNSIVLEGSGALESKLQFRNPRSSVRSSSDHAVVQFSAHEIVVRGLTFSQTFSESAYLASYYAFFGRSVVLEDCIFDGPIWVKADRVRIINCRFNALENNFDLFPAGTDSFVCQHLLLQPFDPVDGLSPCTWNVESNVFNSKISVGSQASVRLYARGNAGENLHAKVTHNVWTYSMYGLDCVPAIDIGGEKGNIEIGHNRFVGATGVSKNGNTAAQTVPFDGLYGGAPIMRYNNDTQMYATGYISAVKGRARSSKLHIHDNYFDLSSVGDGHLATYAMWGGVMMPFNYITNGNSDNIEYHNVKVENNQFLMRNSIGWNDGDGNPQPATWGYWLSPTFQDGQNLNNVQVENISVCGNNFDLGGESALTKQYCWRGILAGQITSWPASGGHLTDTVCLIGIQLKNTNSVAGNMHTGRSARDIEISSNRIYQRKFTGQTNFVNGLIETVLTLSTASVRWSAGLILVDGGGLPLPNPLSANTAGASDLGYGPMSVHPSLPANSGLLFGPKVNGNFVAAPIYNRSAAGTVSYGNAAIDVIGAFAPSIGNNNIYMLPEYTVGIALRGTIYGLVSSNVITAGVGCYSEYTNFVGNNVFNLCPSATAGTPDVTHDSPGANFTS